MNVNENSLDQQPVVGDPSKFDHQSGSFAERLLFNYRPLIMLACLLVTVVLGWQASKLQLNASFEKMIPTNHPYIVNFLEHRTLLAGAGNAVRIAVENKTGNVFDHTYLEILAKINDEVFLVPGVDRAYMKSLWTPATRWTAVTEEGLDGGTVIPEDYDGSPESLDNVRENVERSGEIGQLVAADLKSSIIFVPVLDRNPKTGEPLDYREFSDRLEEIRAKHQNESTAIYITGFAKLIGDLITGLAEVLVYFALAIVIATGIVFSYTRCIRSTVLVVLSSLIAVLWLLGILPTLGYALDPYSMLVPFLVFAIGMSHGAQKMNGIMQDIGRGTHKLIAARYTFRRLFLAGLTALLADAVGFAVLLAIDIPVIQQLAIAASIGVAVLIFTNLILLPILLSYTGVSPAAAERSLRAETGADHGGKHPVWAFLDLFTERRWAMVAIAVSAVLAVVGFVVSQNLKIGDLDPGAPELRPESRYNRDTAFLVQNYSASADILAVMVETPEGGCTEYSVLAAVDRLAWQLEQLPGVEATTSAAEISKLAMSAYNEGNLKWYGLIPNPGALGTVQTNAPRDLLPQSCTLVPLYVFLKDHKADTLTRVVDSVEAFAAENNSAKATFKLAAGNAGIEAATNIVVKRAWLVMLFMVYGAVALLCLITFRSWRAVVVAMLPLVLTSLLAEALMVWLGMGVKVATLPVIALGVGIGVDYALYILTVIMAHVRQGRTLSEAYYRALLFTGKVVMLTGVTLACGVITWVMSDIKFQADMGILLAFMFLWNMLGAMILLPALAHFLLGAKKDPIPVSKRADAADGGAVVPLPATKAGAGASAG